jgi:hypothetical protein
MTPRLAAVLILLLPLAAPAGTLVTRDGQTLAGPLRLADSQITINTDAGPRTLPLASIVSADFKTAATAAPRPGHGLRGEYFRGKTLKRLLLTRTDPAVDYNWSSALPPPALPIWGREFSVRWTGQLRPDHAEKYTLITNADDGVRVWIGGRLVIDRWYDSSGADVTADVLLEKDRKYDLVVEYYNGPADARATLSWASASTPREVIPPTTSTSPRRPPGPRPNSSRLRPPAPTAARRSTASSSPTAPASRPSTSPTASSSTSTSSASTPTSTPTTTPTPPPTPPRAPRARTAGPA